MPIYEYECNECHRRTEKRQKFSDPEITACPHCGSSIERVLSAPAFSFAGGGWYKDLYSSAKPPGGNGSADGKTAEGKAEGGKGESGKAESGKGEGKSDSAPGKADAGSASPSPAPAAAPAAATTGSDKK